ncbi:MAG: hypothetical protein HXY43_16530 [Fischerella sp.]|jgi:hypothetical protein|uniref:hypothetical protein n=1 Tax=Fischerella sp. TaxID=1191 RepID=UPI00179239B7|nr:hypothetical protein [Fischerella sp.]NWF60812.1 hypothetical protein [Fischerella sp.]
MKFSPILNAQCPIPNSPLPHSPTPSLGRTTQNHENIFNECGEWGHLFGISEDVLKLGVHQDGSSRYYSR